MPNRALTTLAFDRAGNAYQVVYPSAPAYNNTAFPLSTPDTCAFELIPHRVFVGGFTTATTESELRALFERFGDVREVKLIRNGEGTSKGYGFVTFDSEEEAKAVIARGENEKLELKGRRLNLGPAVRRAICGPRFSQQYTLSTATGQILTANAYGGFSYAYPQSPCMVLSPTQTTPSFVYSSPASVPSVFVYPSGTSGYENSQTPVQMLAASAESVVPAAGNATSIEIDPNNRPPDAFSVAVYATPQMQRSPNNCCITPSESFVSVAQPLTPVTPSVISQQTCGYPSGAYYVPANVQNIDMTHYSQMNPPIAMAPYIAAPNTIHSVKRSAQSMAVPTSVSGSLVRDRRKGQRSNTEWIPAGWQATTQVKRSAQSMAVPTSVSGSLVRDRRKGQRSNTEWIPAGWQATTQVKRSAQSMAVPTSVSGSLVRDRRKGQRSNTEWIPAGWQATTQVIKICYKEHQQRRRSISFQPRCSELDIFGTHMDN
ncbi:DAZ protein 1 [Toxocara canis]|uniref:DAZ protein 1 n=1 Tax=Toxocara canis TaxID=6265 RepID=A0A0B2UV69_TOXCA|nr:DAZ protein 1 [Toxocara canis]